jgi:hypothetical protein
MLISFYYNFIQCYHISKRNIIIEYSRIQWIIEISFLRINYFINRNKVSFDFVKAFRKINTFSMKKKVFFIINGFLVQLIIKYLNLKKNFS